MMISKAKRSNLIEATFRTVFLLALLAAFSGGVLTAQSIVGSINGIVTDTTGAAIPNATVVVVNVATSQKREYSTDSAGSYAVTALQPGVYQVRVEAKGFEVSIVDSVNVSVGAGTRVDATLKIGSEAISVKVSASEQAALQTDSGEVRSELSSAQLSNFQVPASRNYQSALILIPGISPPANVNSMAGNPGRGLLFSTNGTFSNANNARIDGASAINPWLPYAAGYNPGLEAIDSVDVVTNSYDPAEGLAGGASVNVHVKTGGNRVHGSIFEDHTDNALTAKPFFLPSAFFTRNLKDVDNAFGGTVGGPILKDHVFFFFSYDAHRVSQQAGTVTTVPTAAMQSGNFQASPTPIYDPTTGTAGSGKTAIPGNQLTMAQLSTPASLIAQQIQKSIPTPNEPQNGISNNYYATGPFTILNNKYDADVTWKATSKLNLEARYGQLYFNIYDAPIFNLNGDSTGPGVSSAGGRAGTSYGDTYNSAFSAIYVFNQHLVYNGNFTATVLELGGDPPEAGTNVGQNLGIPGTNGPNTLYGGWPEFTISNIASFGNSSPPIRFNDRDNQFQHSLIWTRGSHTLTFGGNIEREILDFFQASLGSLGGLFNFTGAGTTTKGGAGANAYNAYADFILGDFSSGSSELLPYGDLKSKFFQYSLFAQDKWVASRRLSVSYGVRWDHFPIGGRDHRGFERYNATTNTMMICGVAGNPHNCGYGVGDLDFSPSLGLSYKLTPSTVLRGGGGLNRDPYPLASNRDLATNFPNDLTSTVTSASSNLASYTLTQGLPAITPFDISTGTVAVPAAYTVISLLDHNTRDYVETWNLALEQNLSSRITLQAAYVGSRQVKVPTKLNVNAGLPGGGTASQPLNVAFGRTAITYVATPVGRNQYDALQTQATMRAGSNYTMNVGYTWSKSFDYCCDTNAGETLNINSPGYLRLNRGLSNLDRTYVLTAAGTAKFPFGKNQRWLTSGVPAAIAGGWQVSAVLEAYSGSPFTVSSSSTSLNAPGDSTQYANRVKKGKCILPAYGGPTASYVDGSCFAPVTTATFGTAGPNNLRGPGVKDLNATLQRTFPIRELVKLEIRAEAFNVTNTPHFANPTANVSSSITYNSDGSVKTYSGFGALSAVNSRDQEGIDQRFYRLDARITF